MYTTNIFRHLLWGALVLGISQAQGQSTILGHSGGTGDHLGWNAGTLQALEVRHDGNWPIQWWTDQLQWMMLNPLRQPTINTFTVETNGFLGLSGNANFFNSAPGPFTRLHLADNDESQAINAQQFGFREWQRNGITFTGNADHGYIGQEHNGTDTTDMVILWSDKQRLRQPRSEIIVG